MGFSRVGVLLVGLTVAASWSCGGAEPYAGAVTAHEMLVLTLGNDLRSYRRHVGLPPDPDVETAHRATLTLLEGAVVWRPGGGWVLQPGALSRHPDYLHAGQQRIISGAGAAPVDSVGWDVSHFLGKWPVFLLALGDAADSTDQARVRRWERGVARQLWARVIRPPSHSEETYRFTTFMDGTDGVYRLDYEGRGKGWGYAAGAFSVVPYYAPMALLRDPRVTQMYGRLSSADEASALLEVVEPDSPAAPEATLQEGQALVQISAGLDRRSSTGQRLLLNDAARSAYAVQFRPALLAETAWIGANAYEGAISRQVPLHAAFWHGEKAWQSDIHKHVRRFLSSTATAWPETSTYDQLHQWVFVSRYLALCVEAGVTPVPGTAARLHRTFRSLWRGDGRTVVSNTGWGEPSYTAYRDWVRWKVTQAPRWQNGRAQPRL